MSVKTLASVFNIGWNIKREINKTNNLSFNDINKVQ